MTLKQTARRWIPTALVDGWRAVRQRQTVCEWEYVPDGWEYALTHPEARGWNVDSVLAAYQQQWPAYVHTVTQTGPLGVLPETAGAIDLAGHNAAMSLGYVLALAKGGRSSLELLDWGGGIGHTYLLARALLPHTDLHYTCHDVPLLTAHGARLFPEQTFLSDSIWKGNTYDLVMASAALHYAEEWAQLVTDLAAAARNYLYVAKLPVVLQSDSFVFIQRPYRYGYGTEYLSWCLNRGELLEVATSCRLSLVREFIYGHRPLIHNAPEQNEYRGFLFQVTTRDEATGGETTKAEAS